MRDTRSNESTELGWERPVDGFRWVDHENVWGFTRRFLMPSGAQMEKIRPIDNPELLRGFAELETTEEAILVFANRYGQLTSGSILGFEEGCAGGEDLEVWEFRIKVVHDVVGIWDCVAEGDGQRLKKWLSFDGPYVTYVGPDYPDVWTDERISVSYHLDSGGTSDLLDAGADMVVQILNRNFRDVVTWRHFHSLGERRLEAIPQPIHLLAAIWSQFSQLTRGGADQRRCPECGTWFTIAVGRKRSDSLFDRDACKSKAYRTRKANAIRMRQEGMKLRDIAKKLDTELAVVSGWIDSTKRKPKPVTNVGKLRARHKRKLKARGGA